MLINIELPTGAVSHEDLIKQICAVNAMEATAAKLVFVVPEGMFIATSAMSFLVTWGLERKSHGCEFSFVGADEPRNYLSRINLFKILGVNYVETFKRHSESGRFLPIKLIDGQESIGEANSSICELVLRNFDNAKEFLPALEWSVYELLDNIRIHSETPVPGTVCAQYYPYKHLIEVGIADYGRGIKASLEESQILPTHAAALKQAITRGITRNKEVGAGNGLAGTVEITMQNGGEFILWSGDASFYMGRGFEVMPMSRGTGIKLTLDTRRPVDLSKTFIGSSDWSYIDHAVERLQEQGGLKIVDECIHVGGREPAKELRLKIMTLLTRTDQPIVLNFEGITLASSSFFDELLGRLAKHLGEKVLRERIKLTHVTPTLKNMINQVVGERLKNG